VKSHWSGYLDALSKNILSILLFSILHNASIVLAYFLGLTTFYIFYAFFYSFTGRACFLAILNLVNKILF